MSLPPGGETDTETGLDGKGVRAKTGCDKPGDWVPKPLLEWVGGQWEGFSEEGTFGVILMNEQELGRQEGVRVGRGFLYTGNSPRSPEDILINPQNNPRRQEF